MKFLGKLGAFQLNFEQYERCKSNLYSSKTLTILLFYSFALNMAAEHESRPLYFANGDFAKTVADIIASPRRGKAYASQDALYEISERQRDYYTKCFRHLMKATQGTTSLEGALNGGDLRVVDFFKRSGLDNDSLSRIWSLSDVNEDGWLDINEFSTAMHLIVLKVKGQVAIPFCLPACLRPPLTPPRASSQVQNSPIASCSAPQGPPSSGSWDQFDNVDFALQNATNTIKKDTHLAEFSDVPPLLVDSRPTAVKQTVPLLALKSPSGPPPQPPPRPQQRGHIRSASLDMMKHIQLSHAGLPLASGDRRASDSTSNATEHAHPLATSGAIPTAVPPPIPQRVSPPAPIPRKSSTAETQTEGYYVEAKEIEQFIADFDTQIAELLGDESDATAGKGVERWARRCEGLRAQNAELEAERARMAQVRVQLELRLQELEEGNARGRKPTSL
ncbi:hypothetical protein Y032_0097g3018 [Ancylostoma ceylanicum]|uniref:EF hand n=1 Tax=Ancylostoma ceylanicum TaxID=53326 RepID=A0A016TJR1_9BILA|nr:hypothetical protein Y032_0097g3018 [Ancylostoma ceylanicum]